MDQLGSLPGEAPPEKEAAWQRLHTRLQQKKQRTRKTVCLIAAAALLPAVILAWWLQEPANRQPVPSNSNHMPAVVSLRPQAAPPKQDAVLVVRSERAEKRSGPLVLKDLSHHTPVVSPLKAYTPEPMQEPVQQITVEPVPAVDTSRLIASLPVRKKLKVVHINELENASAELPLARKSGATFLQAKLTSREDFSRFYISRNTSDDILKVKLSPN